MSNALVAPKNAMLVQRRNCPLCESKSRPQIDLLITELLRPDEDAPEHHLDTETGEITDNQNDITFIQIEASLRELLTKLNDEDTTFALTDLIVHATQHALVTQFEGVQVRSEGNLLVVGDKVYQKIDPKDSLALGIAVGLQHLVSGRMKITAAAWTNMQALLWRMMGNAGADEFIQAMLDKTQNTPMNPESPLGAAFLEREQKLAHSKKPIPKENEETETE